MKQSEVVKVLEFLAATRKQKSEGRRQAKQTLRERGHKMPGPWDKFADFLQYQIDRETGVRAQLAQFLRKFVRKSSDILVDTAKSLLNEAREAEKNNDQDKLEKSKLLLKSLYPFLPTRCTDDEASVSIEVDEFIDLGCLPKMLSG